MREETVHIRPMFVEQYTGRRLRAAQLTQEQMQYVCELNMRGAPGTNDLDSMQAYCLRLESDCSQVSVIYVPRTALSGLVDASGVTQWSRRVGVA